MYKIESSRSNVAPRDCGKWSLAARAWLAGLKNPAVAKALSIIHRRYAEYLDVHELARAAGVSRTLLRDRSSLLCEPPIRPCAKRRMRTAANMLANTGNIGYAVGVSSEAAFARAFRREYGEPGRLLASSPGN